MVTGEGVGCGDVVVAASVGGGDVVVVAAVGEVVVASAVVADVAATGVSVEDDDIFRDYFFTKEKNKNKKESKILTKGT